LILHGKLKSIHKHPIFIWNHRLPCCERIILLSISVSLSVDLQYAKVLHIDNVFYGRLKDLQRSFLSSHPSCLDKYVASNSQLFGIVMTKVQLYTFVVNGSRLPPPRDVAGLQYSIVYLILTAFFGMLDNSRMGTAIRPNSRNTCSTLPFFHSSQL
jgi:hypothetical protein